MYIYIYIYTHTYTYTVLSVTLSEVTRAGAPDPNSDLGG